MLTANVEMGRANTGFILSEANGHRSRENGTVVMPNVLEAGTVVAEAAAIDLDTTADWDDGGTAVTGMAANTGLVVGQTYSITGTGIPAGTTFVYGPTANTGTLSQAATAAGVDGAVTITHAAGLEAWTGAADTPVGILLYNIDATDLDMAASYIARDAEVNKKALVYPDGEDPTSDLAALNIIVRD